MYALPACPTVADVIARSATCHPSLYADALASTSHTHGCAAASMRHHAAVATARRLASTCTVLALALRDGMDAEAFTFYALDNGPDAWISALNVAARLQCLPSHMVSEAVARHGVAA